jgi:hypothetical protein
VLDVKAHEERIEALVAFSEDFEDRLAKWQEDGAAVPDATAIRAARREYAEWYATALHDVPEVERPRFMDMYEGGAFTKRIRAFLTAPLEESALHNPADPASPFSRWQYSFSSTFQECIAVQRDILIGALSGAGATGEAVEELVTILGRFSNYVAALRAADRPTVPAPTIENEADLQVVIRLYRFEGVGLGASFAV